MDATIRLMARRLMAAMSMLLVLSLAPIGGYASETPSASEPQAASEEKVQAEVDRQLMERRKAMLEEAHAALDETQSALQALEAGDRSQALEALARATGKLELLIARDPDLALAPVQVDFITHDLYATPEAIRKARDRARDLLDEGRVQEARSILSGLASEFIISVTNLPLATYPDAIKAISPLIDEGKLAEAKDALRAALNTLVVTDQVIALPVLRAQAMLDRAEELVGKETTVDEDAQQIAELVAKARVQLEMAELLGYVDEDGHEKLRDEIAELESTIGGDEETSGIFAKLRRSLAGFQSSFLE